MHEVRTAGFAPTLFQNDGVRGAYPEELNEKAAYAVARAFVEYCALKSIDRAPRIVIAHARVPREDSFSQVLIDGARTEGASTFYIGFADAAKIVFAEKFFEADGAILISLTDNHEEESVLRFWTRGIPLSAGELDAIGKSATRNIFDYKKEPGSYIAQDVSSEYRSFLHSRHASDSSHMAGVALMTNNVWIQQEAVLTFIPPEQITRDVLQVTIDDVGEAIQIGSGADHMNTMTPSQTAALYVEMKMKAGDACMLDFAMHRSIRTRAEKRGVRVLIAPSGQHSMVEALDANHAQFGAERSGRYYFSESANNCSGFEMALHLLEMCASTKKALSQIAHAYEDIIESPELFLEVKNQEVVLDKIATFFHDSRASYADGVVIEDIDWRCILRPSPNRRGLLLYIDGETRDVVDKKIKLFSELIGSYDGQS